MATLHIDHEITDFATWKAAFDGFEAARTQAGVRQQRVRRPVDDDHRVVIDLEFGTSAQASQFLGFLRSQVWGTSRAPALVGSPSAAVLADVPVGTGR